jgi:hypothetical protein
MFLTYVLLQLRSHEQAKKRIRFLHPSDFSNTEKNWTDR